MLEICETMKINYKDIVAETIIYVFIVFLIYNLFPMFPTWAGLNNNNTLTFKELIFYIIIGLITTIIYNYLYELNKKHNIL